PEEALEILRRANPFPAVVGRVCPAPCENSCLRRTLGGSVSIRAVERFLGDFAIAHNLAPPAPTRRKERMAVVGAGPAGLAAAYALGLEGYAVTVFEEKPKAGGLLRYGIPPFRLPRAVLDAELDLAFRNLPVEFRFHTRVTQLPDEYSAVILAAGKNVSADTRVPGSTPEMAGLRMLEAIGRGEEPRLSGTVAVIGGGSTAFDCARAALRLGARPTIYYRRSRGEMPAFAHDLQEAQEEGIPIVENAAPTRIEGHRFLFARTRSAGRQAPVEVLKGTEFLVKPDHILFATGETQEVLFHNLQKKGAALPVDDSFATSTQGVFAAGDFTSAAPGTVSGAILQGRLAAAAARAALSPRVLSHARGASEEVVRLENLNLNYFDERRRVDTPRLEAETRVTDFAEVDAGLDEGGVTHEARRCMSCGTCVFCFNCRNYCADGAVMLDADTQRFSIDLDHCKGCLVCVAECPRYCMGSRYAAAGTADRK
ncbi:MAG: FAD-dependent oxidoreductase, partial [Planctomycetes bacterium]|nr:FAD-dependent oxidoreductase [Planctomycetota bacterium]